MARKDTPALVSSAERRPGPLRLMLPVVVLLLVVALVSLLVLTEVVQGHAVREGPEVPPTTQPSVIIFPR